MVTQRSKISDYVAMSVVERLMQYKTSHGCQSVPKFNKRVFEVISTIGFSLLFLEKSVLASEVLKQSNKEQLYLKTTETLEVPVQEIIEPQTATQVVAPPDSLLNLRTTETLKVPVQETPEPQRSTQVVAPPDTPLSLRTTETLEVTVQKTLEPQTQTEVFTQASLLKSKTIETLEVPFQKTPEIQAQTEVVREHPKVEQIGVVFAECSLDLLLAGKMPALQTCKNGMLPVVTPQESPLNWKTTQNLETPVQETPEPQTQPEVVSPQESARKDNKWFVTVYGGTGTNSSLGQALTLKTSEFYDSFFNDEIFIGLEGGRKLLSNNKNLSLEVLGQMRQHIGDRGYLALESALVVRWDLFPGSNFLNTTLAIGNGLSYVTALPGVEETRPTSFNKSNLLNYLLIETTFSLPKSPEWSLVLRLNHRSGVFGLFNGVKDGSNNFALGIRRSF